VPMIPPLDWHYNHDAPSVPIPMEEPMPNREHNLSAIGSALDAISWEWLNDNHPELAMAIELEVDRGATPYAIRRYVVQRTQRIELALRCEQAASHLVSVA